MAYSDYGGQISASSAISTAVITYLVWVCVIATDIAMVDLWQYRQKPFQLIYTCSIITSAIACLYLKRMF
ncbi:hypothetical protein D7V21_10235 [Acinetobacter guerrae]|uniref:Uncharacterized protein n=1 Tax=Acinetobacter guerrae TaxID=1843371 RepID=A0A3A8EF05_9GAMM|nr:hypothetical protein [Acinetobacter guerrae]RKG33195.1 hypothetical protein D7V21_10235 [Acinetobacter guerrae]